MGVVFYVGYISIKADEVEVKVEVVKRSSKEVSSRVVRSILREVSGLVF